MKRVKLVIAYDGTNYHGWQLQANGLSIEEVLNETLSSLLHEQIQVIGASRTDSGVHAMGNVAVFDTQNRMPADKICFALNQRLPADIRIQSSAEVPPDWHPRKQNCIKTYEYKILNRKIEMPLTRLYTYFCYFPIDVEAMGRAAGYLTGEHDFKSFCTVRTQAEDTVRTVYSLTVNRDKDDVVTVRICGSGFLYNMVRIIAGTLLRVGTGMYGPEHVEEILQARDRQAAGPTLPAKGLTLISLDYEKELKPEITVSNQDWEYCLVQREIPVKGKAYLVVRRCKEADFQGLITRLTHQAARNGARWIYVTDTQKRDGEGPRLYSGQQYGYYQFKRSYCYLEMEKAVLGEENQPLSPLSLQTLGEEERDRWAAWNNEAFFPIAGSATYDAAMIEEEERSGSLFFWITFAQAPVGTAILVPDEKNKALSIDMIGIHPRFQGKGYGREALRCIQQYVGGRGFKKLSLLVADTNQRARKLYQSFGFRTVSQRPDFFYTESNLPAASADTTAQKH